MLVEWPNGGRLVLHLNCIAKAFTQRLPAFNSDLRAMQIEPVKPAQPDIPRVLIGTRTRPRIPELASRLMVEYIHPITLNRCG
jgi:hypothetical protein